MYDSLIHIMTTPPQTVQYTNHSVHEPLRTRKLAMGWTMHRARLWNPKTDDVIDFVWPSEEFIQGTYPPPDDQVWIEWRTPDWYSRNDTYVPGRLGITSQDTPILSLVEGIWHTLETDDARRAWNHLVERGHWIVSEIIGYEEGT